MGEATWILLFLFLFLFFDDIMMIASLRCNKDEEALYFYIGVMEALCDEVMSIYPMSGSV